MGSREWGKKTSKALSPIPYSPFPTPHLTNAWVYTDHNRAPAVGAAVRPVAVVFLQPQPLQTPGAARSGRDLRARWAGDGPGLSLESRRPIAVHRHFRAYRAFAHSHAPVRSRPR